MKKIKYLCMILMIIVIFSCAKKSKLEYSGTIESVQYDLSSETTGKIMKIMKKEGDKVKKGELLMIIEHKILDLKLDNARNSLESARENFISSKKNYKTMKKTYSRISNLFKQKSVSQSKMDETESKFVQVRSAYKIAKSNYKKVINEIKIIKEQIKNCYIRSPIDGLIVEKINEKGGFVNPGSLVYTVSDIKNMEVYIYIPEKDLGYLKVGQEVKIFSDTYPEKGFNGKIYYISEEAEFTPKNVQTKEDRVKLVFKIKIKVKNENRILKSGMPCDVKIKLENDV